MINSKLSLNGSILQNKKKGSLAFFLNVRMQNSYKLRFMIKQEHENQNERIMGITQSIWASLRVLHRRRPSVSIVNMINYIEQELEVCLS